MVNNPLALLAEYVEDKRWWVSVPATVAGFLLMGFLWIAAAVIVLGAVFLVVLAATN